MEPVEGVSPPVEPAALLGERPVVATMLGADRLFARHRDTTPAELPPWLAVLHPAGETHQWAAQIQRVHPADRPAVVRCWWRALAEPGSAQQCRVRSHVDGEGWRWTRTRIADLVDDPAVGVVLIASVDEGPVDLDPGTPPEDRATWDRPAWIRQRLDARGVVLATEGDVVTVFGRQPGELVGRTVLGFLHPDDHEAGIAMWVDLASDPGGARVIRQRVVRPDGSVCWIESTVINEGAPGGEFVSVSHVIDHEAAEERALRASEEEFRTLAEGVPVAVFRARADGTVVYGKTLWHDLVPDAARLGDLADDDTDVPGHLERLMRGTDAELDLTVARGGRVLRLRCRRSGDHVVGTVEDVTASVRRTAELERRADHDPLTGVANRRRLERTLSAALEGDTDLVVVFVDLDGFKAVNDTWGHRAGDAVLAEVAARLRDSTRPGDVVARYGGDEFVLLCHHLPPDAEDELRARIRAAVSRPVDVGPATWTPRVSIGIVRPGPGDDVAGVLARADRAMYQRKRR